jgi:endoglucanase
MSTNDPRAASRRRFLGRTGLAGAALAAAGAAPPSGEAAPPLPRVNRLPRWRGFNLQNLYRLERGITPPEEDHFRRIAGWGFDFVRLPMTYWAWLRKKPSPEVSLRRDDVYDVDESGLALVDRAVEYGGRHGVHVCLCFHRAPGFRTGSFRDEPFNLWKDEEAATALAFHWELFAKRYRDVPASRLSFNLFNEAPWPKDYFNGAIYRKVVTPAVEAIRRVSPSRTVIADGAGAGNLAVPELVPLGVEQGVHCYIPGSLSHYRVDWMKDREWPDPAWPAPADFDGYPWDRARLELFYSPWRTLIEQGVGVHLGETGGSNRLPHAIFLAWLRDVLELFKDMGVGWALWNLVGESGFGILDTGREDVEYEDWYGHRLDKKMLRMLQEI